MHELDRQVVLGFAHQPLAEHLHFFAERGWGKALAPHLAVQGVHHVGAAVFGGQRAVGFDAACERGRIKPFARHLGQGLLEHVKRFFGHRAAGRHGVAAKFQQHTRMALGHQIQRIAQVKAGDGAARSLELVRLARRAAGSKHKGGTV